MEFSMENISIFSDLIGTIAGIITTSALIPQTIKIYKTKSAKDVSLAMFVFLGIGIFLWFFYGILIKEFPVILANFVSLILISVIILMKIRYG
jgi:MtN3 and saliva related transmembrane protein